MEAGSSMNNSWPDAVTNLALQSFDSLQRKGKPRDNEWTTLCSFITCAGESMEVVSCATGTRCLGKSQLDFKGCRLYDSHAEVLARRAFQRYLMTEITSVYNGHPSKILHLNEITSKVNLKFGVRIVFFTTQTPCGDASIFVRPDGDIHPEMKRKLEPVESSHKKRAKLELSPLVKQDNKHDDKEPKTSPKSGCEVQMQCNNSLSGNVKYVKAELFTNSQDLYRTGAKCVPGAEQDQLLPGCQYHVPGVLRTKPGRGDPTLSLSCSDKLARWNILGCQGCFPMIFLEEPIYIDSIVISGCIFDKKAMTRAVYGRLQRSDLKLRSPYRLENPTMHYADIPFIHSKQYLESLSVGAASDCKITPCSSSVIWYRRTSDDSIMEVSVDGYKQGVTKKALESEKSRLAICRFNMFKELQRMFGNLDSNLRVLLLGRDNLPSCYQASKDLVGYTQVWNTLTTHDVFKMWPRKDRRHSMFDVESSTPR